MRSTRTVMHALVTAAVSLLALLVAPLTASAAPAPDDLLDQPRNGREALRSLADRLPAAAARNGMSAQVLSRLLDTDRTAWVDRSGKVFFVEEPPPPPRSGDPQAGAVPQSGAYPNANTFALHSRPGAARVLYLDFDGHSLAGTAWDNGTAAFQGQQPGLDLDGSPTTWSQAEHDLVQSVWQRVSEDFAPFDLDVTTQDPGAAAISRSDTADAAYGTRVAMINSPGTANVLCGGGCGGIAYINVFSAVEPTHSRYQPAIVYLQAMHGSAKNIAEAASHEAGHNLNLQHDGTAAGSSYYSGHGAWAPVMGSSYTKPVTQWSSGEYAGADNSQDDLSVMAAAGAPRRQDDHGGTVSTATAAPLPAAGVVGSRTDVDVFRLDRTCTGVLTASAVPAPVSPDLDVRLRLLSATGQLLSVHDPASSQLDGDRAAGLSAAVTADLPAGTYYLEVDGVGSGDPLSTGYSDYASVGAYTLSAGGCSASPPGVPTSVGVGKDDAARSGTVSWAPPVSDGGSPVTGYRVSRDGVDAAGGGPVSTVVAASARSFTFTDLAAGSTYRLSVAAVNAVGTGPAGSGSVTIAGSGVRTVVLTPTADTMARQQSPTVGSGAVSTLVADVEEVAGSATRASSYLRFAVPALAAGESVVGAELSLQVGNGTTNGPAVWRTDSGWSESGLTWSSGQPARSGTAAVGNFPAMGVGRIGTPVSGVTAGGDVSFQLYAESTDGLGFASRENTTATNRPRLTLQIASGATAPALP